MIQIGRQCNTINDSKNTTIDKSSFYTAKYFLLLLDLDILENIIVDLIRKEGGGIWVSLYIVHTKVFLQ